jgi:hypothetical protein
MMTLDPYFVRLKHDELMREAGRRRQVETALAARPAPARWAPLRLPRRAPRHLDQPGKRAA